MQTKRPSVIDAPMNARTHRRVNRFSIWPAGLHWLPIWIFLSGLAWSEETPTPADFSAALFKSTDRAYVRLADGRLTIRIRSESGIGSGTIRRAAEAWPKVVVIKLHLSGLEKFRVTAGKTTIAAAVSGNDQRNQRVEQIVGKDEVPLAADHPLRPTILMLDRHGKPTNELPLKNGRIEITLPAKLLEGNPPSLHFEWVDFYRG